MKFENGNTTTFDLSYFLGTNWFTDEHINMMIQTISCRLEESPKGKRTIVAPLAFSLAITNLKLKEGVKHALLDRYKRRIEEHRATHLYFPLNVNQNHWVTGVVDFEASGCSLWYVFGTYSLANGVN
jgi:Ulp1 protease family, C-terminal catalytic domain